MTPEDIVKLVMDHPKMHHEIATLITKAIGEQNVRNRDAAYGRRGLFQVTKQVEETTMKVMQVFECCDGTTFNTSNSAQDYERRIFQGWLLKLREKQITVSLVDVLEYIESPLNDNPLDYYGTPADMFKDFLEQYFQSTGGKV